MTSTASAESGLPNRILSVNSDLGELETVLTWFERQSHTGVPTDLWMQAQLALVEGFTNAVRHAQAHLVAPPKVQISLHVSSRVFCLQIIDHGEPFDFGAALARVEAEITASAHDPLAREAHWGLVMFLKLQKEYGWTISQARRDDGTNALSLSHPLTADGSAVASY